MSSRAKLNRLRGQSSDTDDFPWSDFTSASRFYSCILIWNDFDVVKIKAMGRRKEAEYPGRQLKKKSGNWTGEDFSGTSSLKKKKKENPYAGCSEHSLMYRLVESLSWTTETVTLYVNYISIKIIICLLKKINNKINPSATSIFTCFGLWKYVLQQKAWSSSHKYFIMQQKIIWQIVNFYLRESETLGKQNKCMAMNLHISNYTYGLEFSLAILHKKYKMERIIGNY